MISEQINGHSCIEDNKSGICKWYRIKREGLTICEYCVVNKFKSTIRRRFDALGYKMNYTCAIKKLDSLMQCGFDCMDYKYKGFQFAVKHCTIVDYPKFKVSKIKSSHEGIMKAQLPINSYWELIIKTDPNWGLGHGPYYMKCKMISKYGRITNTSPSEYWPLTSTITYKVNSYRDSAHHNVIFIYLGMTKVQSNTFTITIDLYQKLSSIYEDEYEFIRTIPITLKLVLNRQ